jgi:hypothetical protein
MVALIKGGFKRPKCNFNHNPRSQFPQSSMHKSFQNFHHSMWTLYCIFILVGQCLVSASRKMQESDGHAISPLTFIPQSRLAQVQIRISPTPDQTLRKMNHLYYTQSCVKFHLPFFNKKRLKSGRNISEVSAEVMVLFKSFHSNCVK